MKKKEDESCSSNWVISDPTLKKKKKKKKKKKIKLKISESFTLSLQENVREYINTINYGTLHILEDLI
jgi:ATP/ADP translocase